MCAGISWSDAVVVDLCQRFFNAVVLQSQAELSHTVFTHSMLLGWAVHGRIWHYYIRLQRTLM